MLGQQGGVNHWELRMLTIDGIMPVTGNKFQVHHKERSKPVQLKHKAVQHRSVVQLCQVAAGSYCKPLLRTVLS